MTHPFSICGLFPLLCLILVVKNDIAGVFPPPLMSFFKNYMPEYYSWLFQLATLKVARDMA